MKIIFKKIKYLLIQTRHIIHLNMHCHKLVFFKYNNVTIKSIICTVLYVLLMAIHVPNAIIAFFLPIISSIIDHKLYIIEIMFEDSKYESNS